MNCGARIKNVQRESGIPVLATWVIPALVQPWISADLTCSCSAIFRIGSLSMRYLRTTVALSEAEKEIGFRVIVKSPQETIAHRGPIPNFKRGSTPGAYRAAMRQLKDIFFTVCVPRVFAANSTHLRPAFTSGLEILYRMQEKPVWYFACFMP